MHVKYIGFKFIHLCKHHLFQMETYTTKFAKQNGAEMLKNTDGMKMGCVITTMQNFKIIRR